MKKLLLVLTFLLCAFLLSNLGVLAEEGNTIELIGGQIDFNIIPYSRLSEEEENLLSDVWTNILSIEGGFSSLEAEFRGKVFDDVDFRLTLDDSIGFTATNLAFTKEFDNSLLELGLWDGFNNITLKGNKKINNVEGQAVIATGGGWAYMNNEDTFIKYNLNEELALTFKPLNTQFAIGDELANFAGARPKIIVDYNLSEEVDLSGEFWTSGETFTDGNNDSSEREIRFKGSLAYELEEDNIVDFGILMDIYAEETFAGNSISGRIDTIVTPLGDNYRLARENYVVNVMNTIELDETMTLVGEAKVGFGSYKNDGTPNNFLSFWSDDVEASRFDLGLYSHLTKELEDNSEIYGSYKLERISSKAEGKDGADDNYQRLIKNIKHTITLGRKIVLEEGLSLFADISLSPESIVIEDDNDNGPEVNEEWDIFDMAIVTGIRYEF